MDTAKNLVEKAHDSQLSVNAQRAVRRGGVMLNGVRYESSALGCHEGKLVRLVLADNGNQVSVFLLDEWLCDASAVEEIKYNPHRGRLERVHAEGLRFYTAKELAHRNRSR